MKRIEKPPKHKCRKLVKTKTGFRKCLTRAAWVDCFGVTACSRHRFVLCSKDKP